MKLSVVAMLEDKKSHGGINQLTLDIKFYVHDCKQNNSTVAICPIFHH
jgi:hypothetical protein